MILDDVEGRVLGALVEKELTTPQGYPLTDSALLAACNQTTSRDPVVRYDTAVLRPAVRSLREQGLLRTVHRTGERSDKHRHELLDALGLPAPAVALLGLLLLRGPQTLAELRARAERWHPFATLGEVEAAMRALTERPEPLAVRLERQPGRKESRYAQVLTASGRDGGSAPTAGAGLDGADPGAALRTAAAAGRDDRQPLAPPPADAVQAGRVEPATSEQVAVLTKQVQALRDEVEELRAEVARLRAG